MRVLRDPVLQPLSTVRGSLVPGRVTPAKSSPSEPWQIYRQPNTSDQLFHFFHDSVLISKLWKPCQTEDGSGGFLGPFSTPKVVIVSAVVSNPRLEAAESTFPVKTEASEARYLRFINLARLLSTSLIRGRRDSSGVRAIRNFGTTRR